MSDQEDIIALSKKIESAIAQGQQALGQKKQIEEQLKKDYGIEDVAQIDSVITGMEQEYNDLKRRIDSGLRRLKEKYGWEPTAIS